MKARRPEKHPNGNYYCRIRRGGKAERINLGKNERQAMAKLRKLEKDSSFGTVQIQSAEPGQTASNPVNDCRHLKGLAYHHLNWVRDNLRPATFEMRKRYVVYFMEFVGNKLISEINRENIDGFCSYMKKNHTRSGRSDGHALREIKAMFHWGEEREYIDLPFSRWPKVRQSVPESRSMSLEELIQLLDRVPKEFGDFILFLSLLGLRPQEGRMLRWEQILKDESGRRYIKIEHHKTSEFSKVYTPRSVPITDAADDVVRRQKERFPNSPLVFLNADGKPYTKNSLRIRFQRWCKRAGLPPKPPYVLRHCFGTEEALCGVNLAILAQIMGHTKMQTTSKYIANTSEAHWNAVNKLSDRLMSALKTKTADNIIPFDPSSTKSA